MAEARNIPRSLTQQAYGGLGTTLKQVQDWVRERTKLGDREYVHGVGYMDVPEFLRGASPADLLGDPGGALEDWSYGFGPVRLAEGNQGPLGMLAGAKVDPRIPDVLGLLTGAGAARNVGGRALGKALEKPLERVLGALEGTTLHPDFTGMAQAIPWGPKESQKFVRRAKASDGATVDMETGKGLTLGETQEPGYAVARRGPAPTKKKFEDVAPDLDAKRVDEFVRRNREALEQPGAKLGAWKDDGKWYLDVSEVQPERLGAANATINRGERAAFNTTSHPRMSGENFVTAPYVSEPFPTFDSDRALRKLATLQDPPPQTKAPAVRVKSAARGKPRPDELVAKAEQQVAPESPLLKELFGVDRQDLDTLTHQAQRGDNAIDVYSPTRPPSYLEGVMTPTNKAWLREVLGRAGESDKLAGSYGWYHVDPYVRKYQEILGDEEGLRRYLIDNQFGSALSPMSAVEPEITRSSIAAMMDKQGRLPDFFDPKNLPAGTGHIAHTSAHSRGLQRYLEKGDVFSPDLDDAVKTRIYNESRLPSDMANFFWPTGDAHWVRAMGIDKVRPHKSVKGKSGPDRSSVGATEYEPAARFFNSAAEAEGMMGSPAQALIWNAAAPYTGVKTKIGAPYLELVARRAQAAAKRQGVTPEEALVNHILGKDYLGKIDPELLAILGGGSAAGLGLLGGAREFLRE